jgi:hypothetical protein
MVKKFKKSYKCVLGFNFLHPSPGQDSSRPQKRSKSSAPFVHTVNFKLFYVFNMTGNIDHVSSVCMRVVGVYNLHTIRTLSTEGLDDAFCLPIPPPLPPPTGICIHTCGGL